MKTRFREFALSAALLGILLGPSAAARSLFGGSEDEEIPGHSVHNQANAQVEESCTT